ncbi:MAG: F0F1 ATP synthase subunit delta [Thiomicrospira sp.]|uniref:F0F1 ATP synthase subunit delta n=1 Tax=Thiomicrospira sp. TaxID=935 RepID=UPI001A05859F|nr:F0F1 ATP synthase subunit delta [Thiomicrospira sp.]MBE0493491.1 F0F1 ATP synthase subunit delta [Thiomicrospira sp.]
MAELITTARPYAEAAFSFATENKQLAEWSETLNNLALIAEDIQMKKFISNPSHSDTDKVSIFESVMGSKLSDSVKNLLVALADNGRLNALPDVAKLFDQLKATSEKRIKATITSARKPTAEQKSKLSAALNTKFDAEVDIDFVVDESLISGIRIKVGDWVVENTAVTQLQKLGAAIAY